MTHLPDYIVYLYPAIRNDTESGNRFAISIEELAILLKPLYENSTFKTRDFPSLPPPLVCEQLLTIPQQKTHIQRCIIQTLLLSVLQQSQSNLFDPPASGKSAHNRKENAPGT